MKLFAITAECLTKNARIAQSAIFSKTFFAFGTNLLLLLMFFFPLLSNLCVRHANIRLLHTLALLRQLLDPLDDISFPESEIRCDSQKRERVLLANLSASAR